MIDSTMKKNTIWKVLAVISSWGAVFVTGMIIGGNTADGLKLFIVIALLVAVISVGNYYSVDESLNDDEFEEEFCKAVKKHWHLTADEKRRMEEMD